MRLTHLSVAESILSMMRWRTKRLSWNWAGWEKVPNYHSQLSLLLLLTLLFMWSLASMDCHCVVKVTTLKTFFFSLSLSASCQLQMDAMSLFPKMSERKQRNTPRWDAVGHRQVVRHKHRLTSCASFSGLSGGGRRLWWGQHVNMNLWCFFYIWSIIIFALFSLWE